MVWKLTKMKARIWTLFPEHFSLHKCMHFDGKSQSSILLCATLSSCIVAVYEHARLPWNAWWWRPVWPHECAAILYCRQPHACVQCTMYNQQCMNRYAYTHGKRYTNRHSDDPRPYNLCVLKVRFYFLWGSPVHSYHILCLYDLVRWPNFAACARFYACVVLWAPCALIYLYNIRWTPENICCWLPNRATCIARHHYSTCVNVYSYAYSCVHRVWWIIFQ